jgi:hypothetical protein
VNVPVVLATYLDRLEAGDMAGAAACFTTSARYSHPPYGEEAPGSPRHEVEGRAAIRALFERRGVRPTRHEICAATRDGVVVHIAGVVRDDAGAVIASFVSQALLEEATGLVAEYVAYSSRPAVWSSGANREPTAL